MNGQLLQQQRRLHNLNHSLLTLHASKLVHGESCNSQGFCCPCVGSDPRPAWDASAKAVKVLVNAIGGPARRSGLTRILKAKPVVSNVQQSDQNQFAIRRREIVSVAKIFHSLAAQAQPDPEARVLMSGTLVHTQMCS